MSTRMPTDPEMIKATEDVLLTLHNLPMDDALSAMEKAELAIVKQTGIYEQRHSLTIVLTLAWMPMGHALQAIKRARDILLSTHTVDVALCNIDPVTGAWREPT